MTSKIVRIAKELLAAKGNGVVEIDLLTDFERRANTRKIKQRVNDFFGDREAITVENGVWRLSERHWKITPTGIDNIMIAHELGRTRRVVFWSMGAALISLFLLGLLMGLFFEISFEYV